MSNKSFKKAEIVYTRLKNEYGKELNWDDFSALFGISRQAMDKRRRKNKTNYDEIIDIFPDINRTWLHSERESELKSLPVKNKFTSNVNQATSDHAQGMNTELGNQVQEKIFKYLAGVEKGNGGNPLDPIVSALQDQLKSQKAMLEAQAKNIDSMLIILEALVQKKNS